VTTIKADIHAADRIIRRATTTAIALIREGEPLRAEAFLLAAGLSAAMLLGEAVT
jgi:hypothetical protein